MWNCIQTLEFQSSTAVGKLENAFFNQLVVAPWASLILLANAKKNAIYAVHVEFGVGSVPARMNYLAEFSVKIPILSFTVTEETEGTVQVYCVQTQAIQQYNLDVSQCLPPPDEEYNSEPMSMLDKDPVLPQTYDAARNSTGDKGAADFLELGSTAATVIVPAPSVSVPPRSMTASSAFGSPVEVGHREDLHTVTERTGLLDIAGPATVAPVKEILDNFGRSTTSEPIPTNQPSRESVSQVATMPVSHPEVAPARNLQAPAYRRTGVFSFFSRPKLLSSMLPEISSRRTGFFFFRALNCRRRCCRKSPSSRLQMDRVFFFLLLLAACLAIHISLEGKPDARESFAVFTSLR
jgi:hypothetical protein